MSLTDRVSVMRRGEIVATFETAQTSPPELADAMVGRKVILKIDKGEAHPTARVFTPHFNAAAVADVAQVRDALDSGSAQVLDARAAPRFLGQAPEPRAGLASGHMPGALNLPMTDLIADGRLKEPDALEAALTAIGVSGDKPVITSCGSGVSAAVITLALARLGRPIGRLYDGSWTEWGGRSDLPVATG